ncbi:MAG: response regulator [Thermodesulfobacteriota bacterium]|nr:response regulator [Thermodesulfobacteriota bacterium]
MKPLETKPGYFQKFRNSTLNRMAPGVVIEKENLIYWRVRILFAIIVTGLLIGIFVLVPSITLVIKKKLWGLFLFDIVVWSVSMSLLLSSRLRYEMRAAIALILFYTLGLVITISVGPLSGGPIWLFTFAVLVGVLLGARAAIVALCVNAITLMIIGWLISAGIFGHIFPFFDTIETMISAMANFVLLNTIAAISVAVLVKGLVSTHERQKSLYRNLETERLNLLQAKKKLEHEVEERLHTEKVLQESERLYRLLADNVDDNIWTMNMEMKFTYISPSITRLRGYTVEEAMAQSFEEVITPASVDIALKAFTEELEEHNKGQKPRHRSRKVELELNCKDGSTVWTETEANFIYGADGQPQSIIGVTRDITERRQAESVLRESEEKLARSKKMESLGLLAGGVAHDLNNVLSGIVSYPELILLDLPEDSKFRKPIETIQESGHRAVAIVQDLLTVARGVATTKEVLNLNDLIDDYLSSPEHNKLKQFHPTVRIKTKLDTDLFNISGSHIHIEKVVMNLVSNASEAIEGGGNVTISTLNRYIDRPLRGYDDVNIGEYVVLSVSDDGSGISSVDLERIFEPFYTKKVMGRSGTGLGLAVVWNTMQDHQGYIDVTSDENGTTFELFFPITRDGISDKALSIPIKDYQGSQETVLVVDDMESQREISCKMLDTLGYKTKAVSRGEEAVEYLKDNTVDLVLLDMIMDPGINGRETYERIIKIHPKQKAIIVSGFSQTDEVKEAQKLGAGQYIKKPVTLEKIGIAVQQELGK